MGWLPWVIPFARSTEFRLSITALMMNNQKEPALCGRFFYERYFWFVDTTQSLPDAPPPMLTSNRLFSIQEQRTGMNTKAVLDSTLKAQVQEDVQ